MALALGANELSPRGLKLTRNYSPGNALSAAGSLPAGATNATATAQMLATQFRSEGLQLADSDLVTTLFADPKRQQDLIVFIDARDDDHYHPENYLATVLPVCQTAEKIVVYCKGGSCEDSEQTAIFLRDAGIPRDKLFVFAGGFDKWSANKQPIETGSRNSGQLQPASSASGGTAQSQ